MTETPRLHPADLVGFSRLASDAVAGATDIAEAVHRQVASANGESWSGLSAAIAALVYNNIRAVNCLVAGSLTALAATSVPTENRKLSPKREATVAALNGVLGDYLARTDNSLAIPMSIRHCGRSLKIDKKALQSTLSQANGKVLLLVHGLCLNDLQWQRQGHNHGAALGRDLGYTPLYLHYNSGLHVSENGRLLADLVETLVEEWPVAIKELAILSHSMGGLVSRSAYHYATVAGYSWPQCLRRLVFLGTPHHGAPMERLGNWVGTILQISPYTSTFARLGRIRSAGITDMRYGSMVESDWKGLDRFAPTEDTRTPLPLPAGVRCYAIAATMRKAYEGASLDLLGDGLVSVDSALGRHQNPEMSLQFSQSRQRICCGINHWDLLSHPAVYAHIRSWFRP